MVVISRIENTGSICIPPIQLVKYIKNDDADKIDTVADFLYLFADNRDTE